MHTALVGLDLSEVSDRFVEWLPFLAKVGTVRLVLVHVIPVEKLEHVAGGYPVDKLEEELRKEAVEKLEVYAGRLREAGFTVEVPEPPVGEPAPTLEKMAEEHGADYIVVASRGWGWLRSLLLGSTAEELVNIAKRPVLVAKGFKKTEATGAKLVVPPDTFRGPVLAAIDFGDYTDDVIAYALYVAEKASASIVLVHVLEPGEDEEEAKARLENLAEQLRRHGAAVEAVLAPPAKPSIRIRQVAEEKDASLIVLGPGMRRESLVLGTTSEAVLRRTNRHVLVARRPQKTGQ
jgi:nucleotide-binding universal stress UspA family protein